jgi:hypothetical protein
MYVRRSATIIFCAALAGVFGIAIPVNAATAPRSTSTSASPAAASPLAFSPAKCRLHGGRDPHIQTSDKHKGERWADANEFTACKRKVPTLYLSVSLYKTDLLGSYFEDNVHHKVNNKDYVASSPEVKCSNDKQTTDFYAISYSYSIEGGKTYSAEAATRTIPLKCGTPGGSG